MPETTDLTVWANGLVLPPGWSIRGVSISRPYPYHQFAGGEELDIEFVYYDALLTISTNLTFTKRGFDPAWLTGYLTLMQRAPHGVDSSRSYHDRRFTY